MNSNRVRILIKYQKRKMDKLGILKELSENPEILMMEEDILVALEEYLEEQEGE